jgi:prepilin-type N-terminal cleavage/methylation domain-containing protein
MMATVRPGIRGFTLIEALAALAIVSAVLIATAALIHNVAFNFDRGTGRADNAEHLLLAVERLVGDFGSARPVREAASGANAAVAFAGSAAQIRFVAAGGVAAGPQGEEVIGLAVEESDGTSRLVRRRAAWLGPKTPFQSLALQDAVPLLEGRVDIAFAFARVAADGVVTWSETWNAQPLLPRWVRLSVRDRASGAELVPGAQFLLRADAPFDCGSSGAQAACLAGGKTNGDEPAKDAAKGKQK